MPFALVQDNDLKPGARLGGGKASGLPAQVLGSRILGT